MAVTVPSLCGSFLVPSSVGDPAFSYATDWKGSADIQGRLQFLSSSLGITTPRSGFARLRFEHDLDAAVLLVAERLVKFGSFFERRAVGDDE
jgi:hypothetical protein